MARALLVLVAAALVASLAGSRLAARQIQETGLVDADSGGQVVLTARHRQIHAGRHYFASDWATLASTTALEILLEAPAAARAHLLWTVQATRTTEVVFYEGSTHTLGTTIAAVNSDRESPRVAGMAVSRGAGGGADGTAIYHTSFGVSEGVGPHRVVQGGVDENVHEVILARGVRYLISIHSRADDNVVAAYLAWYEVPQP